MIRDQDLEFFLVEVLVVRVPDDESRAQAALSLVDGSAPGLKPEDLEGDQRPHELVVGLDDPSVVAVAR